MILYRRRRLLWFDVGKQTYTTYHRRVLIFTTLWFDVGKQTYTTVDRIEQEEGALWFDVGKQTYTTPAIIRMLFVRCGLM